MGFRGQKGFLARGSGFWGLGFRGLSLAGTSVRAGKKGFRLRV